MELALIIVYFILLLIISLASSKGSRDQAGYFLASRSLSPLQTTSTLAATTIGGSAVILVAGQVYSQGLPFIWTDIAGGAGLLLLGFFLAGKVRETGCFSLPEIAGKQYGAAVRMVSTVLVLVAELGFLALLLRGCAGILQPLTGLSPEFSIIIISLLFIVYTVIGGQRAVSNTDVFQLFLVLAALAVLLFVSMQNAPGWSGLPAGHTSFPFNENYPPVNILSLVLIAGLPHLVGSDIFGKILSARSAGVARQAAINSGFIKILAGIIIGVVGLNAACLLPTGLAPDSVLTELLLRHAHPFISAFVLIGLLSVLLSSADSILLTAATVLSRDLFHIDAEAGSFFGKAMTVFTGLCGIVLTLVFPSMLDAFLFAYTLFSAGIVVPVLLGFWQKPLGLRKEGALAAMIISSVVILILSVFDLPPVVVTTGGILTNAMLLFAVSWLMAALAKGKS